MDQPRTPQPPARASAKSSAQIALQGAETTHLLHFEPLTAQVAGMDFPCDLQGRVRLDAWPPRLRNEYFFARALMGRHFAPPTVRCPPPARHPASTGTVLHAGCCAPDTH